MSRPLVSICIPAYNNPEGIQQALSSVLSQTYSHYDVIITDDSRDEAVEKAVKKYLKKIKQIKYIKNKNPLGSPANWNYCISLAKGKYIKVLHHDDWFAKKTSLKDMVDQVLMLEEDSILLFSASNGVGPSGDTIGLNKPALDQIKGIMNNPSSLLLGNIIGAPSATLYSNVSGIKFDENLIWLVDIDFYINLIKKGFKLVYIDEVLISTSAEAPHQVTASVQNNPKIEIFEYMYLFDKWDKFITKQRIRTALNLLIKYNIKAYREVSSIKLSIQNKLLIFSLCSLRKKVRDKPLKI